MLRLAAEDAAPTFTPGAATSVVAELRVVLTPAPPSTNTGTTAGAATVDVPVEIEAANGAADRAAVRPIGGAAACDDAGAIGAAAGVAASSAGCTATASDTACTARGATALAAVPLLEAVGRFAGAADPVLVADAAAGGGAWVHIQGRRSDGCCMGLWVSGICCDPVQRFCGVGIEISFSTKMYVFMESGDRNGDAGHHLYRRIYV